MTTPKPPKIALTHKGLQQASDQLLKAIMQADWLQRLKTRFYSPLQSATETSDTINIHLENLVNPSVKSLLVAGLFQAASPTGGNAPHPGRPFLLVCPDPQVSLKYQVELQQLLPPGLVERYPAEDFSPYDLAILPVHVMREQYRILKRLLQGERFILLVSSKNLLIRHLSLQEQEAYGLQIEVNQDITIEAMSEQLLAMGYVRTSMVLGPGEFSHRGDIFDIYPINASPIRIDFFGDTIEAIRSLDIDSQRSQANLKTAFIIPRTALILNAKNKERLQEKLTKLLQEHETTLPELSYQSLALSVQNQLTSLSGEQGQGFLADGIEYYSALVHMTFYSLLEYYGSEQDKKTLAETSRPILILDDWDSINRDMAQLAHRFDTQYQEGLEKGRLLNLGVEYHLHPTEVESLFQTYFPHRLYLETRPMDLDFQVLAGIEPSDDGLHLLPLDCQAPERFKANLQKAAEYLKSFRRHRYQVFVTTDHPQRLLDACKENDVPIVYWPEEGLSKELALAHLKDQDIIVAKHGPQEGFLLQQEKLLHLTDTELYGRKQKRQLIEARAASKREDPDTISSISELRPGDYVVHGKHGIGKFVELTQMSVGGENREYLSIQYAGSDKLYVPVDQVNWLSRYRGAGEAAPKLNKMGGVEWSSVKKKVQKSIQSIAKELVQLYAKRAQARGFHFEPDTPWQVEMEEAFPYTETPDQWQAIQDTKVDMESDKPMDRLICGDVGFGKTEVAVRAIFKAVLSGKQVAVLVPTTILAQQHFNILSERFQPYPMRVGLLSRFRSEKEQREVTARAAIGECDVVVGTHRLLQKDVKFKDLGLLVIDEEQRFGVAHKEKIKQMRHDVDVLTMSATPIPRTLYMALSGVREMSLINTPPLNRSPIKTFVGPYNPAQIRMAILQEIDRGGQVYFVHNRVKTIYHVAQELRDLVPEVRFAVGHGQMHEHELENVMLDFAQQQYDVLLCTTIIESGLDIPNVNTIIVDRADRLGLAQLYQLRGRVGRSPVQAYAYCYYDPERQLTEDGKERLRAIREFTSLGSGYQIALRDLEIRGVGNILGSEQHGHMISVGFDLYCQMLEETIETLQGVEKKEETLAIIDLNVTALIPDTWVGDRDVKMTEYKRLANVDSERSLTLIEAEWKDRFGEIPWQTRQLMDLVRLRFMATQLGFPTIRADEEFIRISVPFGLQEWLQYQKKLPAELAKKGRWVPGLASKQGSLPVLLIKHLGMDGKAQVAYLLQLLTQLLKLQKTD